MGPELQRFMAHSCDCRSGMRVNSTCAHVNAALKALCIPSCFRTTKKMATMLGDASLPDEHQPRSSGPPAVPPTTPASAVTPSIAPERLSANSRVNSRDVFCTGFGRVHPPVAPAVRQGYSPDLAAPLGMGNGQGRGQANGRGRGRGRSGGAGLVEGGMLNFRHKIARRLAQRIDNSLQLLKSQCHQ